MDVFDGHTHAFNAGFVPVYGILRAKGLSHETAEPTRAIIEAALERDKPDSLAIAVAPNAPQTAFMEMIAAEARGHAFHARGPDFIGRFALMMPRERLLTIEHILRDTPLTLTGTLSDAASATRLAPWLAADDDVTGLRVRADRVLRVASSLAGPVDDSDTALLGAAGRSVGTIIDWLLLLTRHESRLVSEFASFWRDPGTFVGRTHFMMDMVKHYLGHTVYGFADEQHDRMRAIVAEAALPLIGFTAFDPFRDDCLDIVKARTAKGFCGVKFYPPNGFRPIDNTRKDIKNGPPAGVVNQRNLDFFHWCVDHDIPVFTHCTPSGMESRKGVTGKFSDPKGWRQVLDIDGLSTLRLCFGHAGGQDGWLADFSDAGEQTWRQSYAATVVEICQSAKYPNVYCDFGYFDNALTDEGATRFQRRLEAACGPEGSKFRTTCCYGTDWHLVMVDNNAPTWPVRMRSILSSAALVRSAEDIMYRNAIRFLNLAGFLTRSGGALSAKERGVIESLLARVAATT